VSRIGRRSELPEAKPQCRKDFVDPLFSFKRFGNNVRPEHGR
jgi:hypothetical protein